MSTILVIIGILAVWRITYMIQEEAGPGAIFRKLQAWSWTGEMKDGTFKDGLRCFYCLSVWISIPLGIAFTFIDGYSAWWLFIVYALGLSAGAVIFNMIHTKLEQ